MKFWDTIAKMCGVEMHGRVSTRDSWDGDVIVAGHAFPVFWYKSYADAGVSIHGHGFRLRDSTAFKNASGPESLRIGLIAIERIRPMTAGEVGLKQAAEMLHRAAKAMNPDAPVVLS